MALQQVTLVNACQHKHFVFEVPVGITAIIGGNGMGKSNTLGLIKACLLNDYRHMKGPKQSNVRYGTGDKEASFIQTDWSTAEGHLQIRRGLKNCKSHLLLNGESSVDGHEITKEAEITDVGLRLLGFSKATVSDFLFADFKDLADIVDGSKSTRATMLSNLCGLSKVVEVEKALAAESSVVSAKLGEFDNDEFDSAQIDWTHIKTSRRKFKRQLEKVEAEIQQTGNLVELERKVAQIEVSAERRAELVENLRKIKDRRRKTAQKIEESERSVKVGEFTIKSLAKIIDGIKSQIEVISNTPIVDYVEGGIELPSELADATVANTRTLVPAAVRNYKNDRKKKLYRIQNADAECETCGSLIELRGKDLERFKQQLIEGDQEFSRTIERIEEACKNAEKEIKSLTGKLSSAEKKRRNLEVDIAEKASWLEQSVDTIEELDQSIMDTEQKLKDLPKRRKATAKELASLEHSRKLHAVKQNLRAQLNANSQQVASMVKRLRNIRKKRKRHEKMLQWHQLVKKSREVCHRDRLQKTVIHTVSVPLVASMNQILGELDVSFRVSLNLEQFEFIADHGGGRSESAARLSHGQSLILGISFWLSLARVFQQELPIFFFDEPSANLDVTHELEFARFINKLSDQLESDGKQGVIITHSAVVAEGAGQVYKLDSTEGM